MTVDCVLARFNLRLEASAELDSTTDISQLRKASNVFVSSVVDEGQTTTDGSKRGEGQVGEIGVVDERDITRRGLGEVGERHLGEVVGVEPGRAVDDLESGGSESGDVSNSQVGSPDKLVQADGKLLSIGLEREAVSQVLEVQVDGGQAAVVVDVHCANRLQVNAVQALQESVRDDDSVRLAHTGGKGESVESGQGRPVNRADSGQGIKLQSGNEGQVVEGEGTGDLVDAGTRERDQGTNTVDSQISSDGLDALKIDGVTGISRHDHVTNNAGAACDSSIGSTGNCVCRRRAGLGCRRGQFRGPTISREQVLLRTIGQGGSHEGRNGVFGEHFEETSRPRG